MKQRKDVMEVIEKQRKSVNPRYDLGYNDLMYIQEQSENSTMFGINCFTYGYYQGYQDALNRMKKEKETS